MAQSIRDAIAPVFLMSGVATMLSVTTARFSRIVDRYRALMNASPQTATTAAELVIMYRRSRVIHWSIAVCTICALLVCMVIAVMFISTELHFAPDRIIAFLFVGAMIALIAGLLLFLYEVHLATGTLALLGKTHWVGKKKSRKKAEEIESD
jgi:hypothetical protein